ncbi:hypothetical protein D3C86_1876840 [compost metagenome]
MHDDIRVAQACHRFAHLANVGGLRVCHFHHRATRELHRQVKATCDQEEDRQRKGDEGDRVEHQRVLHERDVFFDSKELHALIPLYLWVL